MPLLRAAARLLQLLPAGAIQRRQHNLTIRPATILHPLLQTLQAKSTAATEAAAVVVEAVEAAETVVDHQGEDNE
jgi:gamma-glutamylcysteine synthetase